MPPDKPTNSPGMLLETLTWTQAQTALRDCGVVVIPLGAAAKQHGRHLPLYNDALIATWLARQVRLRLPVVIAPLINASYYPAFTDYPGSISLRAGTARDIVIDTCRSLAAHGPKCFYVLNTGVSTLLPLADARSKLAPDGIRLRYLDLSKAFATLHADSFEQRFGSHADELETSLMLHIHPRKVDMAQAVDDGDEGEGYLSRTRGQGVWSESGVYGQATLASAAKGRLVADALLGHAIREIEAMLQA